MQKKPIVVAASLVVFALTSTSALAGDGLSNILNRFNNSETITFGATTYSGGGSTPEVRIFGNSHFGDFYLGDSAALGFGHIDGFKADRYSIGIEPGWIVPVTGNLAIVPYLRLAGVAQDTYIGHLRTSSDAHLRLGYNLGGGIGLQWAPTDYIVVNPKFDASFYRQGYYAFNNTTDTHTTVYKSTTEYREQMAVLYYPWKWLHLGLNVIGHQYANGGSFVSYGGGFGINW
ncbi:conserved hypothetical protein [Acidithiobacillus caldus SM-1]|uniref:Outer membrane protein beta-barrel domain-containing protein n=1 Tax=Acidithiobacillus caldus (strain SM-1) TaxID=990288 RepID=F9ZQP8_ACICS|nr:hypothetical protein [Acidithiobacillus caldus]AEK58648.1 conserved hypothetical protein [Acidithiobacillus caldus SM-1]